MSLSTFLLALLSFGRFPPKLRSMCHCLYQVVTQRFQQSTVEAVWIVIGTVIFLRFINPAIGTVSLSVCLLLSVSVSVCCVLSAFVSVNSCLIVMFCLAYCIASGVVDGGSKGFLQSQNLF